ncbi:MAG TPA: EAL domain-containing protein [Candidatus Macondimonas sp.]|nr:EAL domain-containing protein [Candidatus Macondimonas sp.]
MSSDLAHCGESIQLRVDRDGVITRSAGDTQALLGASSRELLGRHSEDFVAPNMRAALRALLMAANEQPQVGQFRLTRPGGDLRSSQWILVPASGGHIWIVVTAALPEHAPHDLSPALGDVLDRANALVFFCDPLGHFLNLNAAMTRITGYTRRELETQNFGHIVHPDDRLLVQSLFLGALGGVGQQGEFRIHTKDGRLHHLMVTNGPLWAREQIIGVVGVARDVTPERTWTLTLRDLQSRLQQVQRIAKLGEWSYDFKTRTAHWSPELFGQLQIDRRDFSSDYVGFRRLIHPSDAARVNRHHRDALRHRRPLDIEYRIVTPRNRVVWVHERGVISYCARGRLSRIEGTLQDVSEQKRLENDMLWMRDALTQSGEAMFVLDAERRVLSANAAFCGLMQCSRSMLQNTPAQFLVPPGQSMGAIDGLWSHLSSIGRWSGPWEGQRLNGEAVALHLNLSAVRDEAGHITHYIGLCRDLSTSSRSTIDLLDPTTALPNRAALMRALTTESAPAQHTPQAMALLWIDLDHFRSINESLDPAVGDQILREVARRFRNLERLQCRMFHLGGDAFAAIAFGDPITDQATRIAEAALETLNEPLMVGGTVLALSASIGISVRGIETDLDTADLIRQAETAMYQAKRHRHCYRLASRARTTPDATPMSAHELRVALTQNELFLVYQPIVDPGSGRICGVEALVRWAHPTRGTLEPSQFLPLAERIGLLPAMGQIVLDEGLAQLHHWRAGGATDLGMAVNLAPTQFASPHLTAQIAASLERHQVPAEGLTVEITEGALLAHPERALETLRALRDLGVRIAIDDFGMGYSSFNYLKQYPFDVLKIDRSFVSALPESAPDVAIVEAMLSMSQRMNLDVIGEGVETESQSHFLTERGCQGLQGYWLSRPLAGAAMTQLLNREGMN